MKIITQLAVSISLLLIPFITLANEKIISKIYSIDYSRDQLEPHLIYFENGQVAFLNANHKQSLAVILYNSSNNMEVEVQVDDQNTVQKIRIKNNLSTQPSEPKFKDLKAVNYEPTVFQSLKEAQFEFKKMNTRYRSRSQCYNRAHVWTYEGNQRSNINWMKVFMFFTAKYIREYNYHWWFHVTPYVLVNTGETVVERTMDRAFTNGPLDLKKWSDYFIAPRTGCPVVTRYSDYRNHQWDAYCYHIKVTQFFWQPRDIEALEINGAPEKTTFIQSEVNAAYRQGF